MVVSGVIEPCGVERRAQRPSFRCAPRSGAACGVPPTVNGWHSSSQQKVLCLQAAGVPRDLMTLRAGLWFRRHLCGASFRL